MKRKRFLLVVLIVMGFSIGVAMFSYLHQDNTVTPQVEREQERIGRVPSTATETSEPHKDSEDITPVEIPEQVEREISGIVEQPQTLHAPEAVETDEENPPTPEEPADPVAAAWARLEYISQNPQEWGDFSPEAAELMAQLTPTWVFDYEADGEGPAENAFKLLKKLVSFQDPRSAQVIANYINEGFGLRNGDVIRIGPPLVPPLIPLLDANTRFAGRLKSVKILGLLDEKHRHELGGAVEHIILPKLEQMATADPSPVVQRRAREAVARLR